MHLSPGPGSLSSCLQTNFQMLQNELGNSYDLVYRQFACGGDTKKQALICFIDGMVDTGTINAHILKPLMSPPKKPAIRRTVRKVATTQNLVDRAKASLLPSSSVQETRRLKEVLDGILSGKTALFFEGVDRALLLSTEGWESRDVKEPATELVVRGPREGFVEDLKVNTALLRRKIKNKNLRLESFQVGTQTKTQVCIAYIQNIAQEGIVQEVRNRLRRIDIDSVLESGYIEQLIEDNPTSIFSTIGNTEKPDILAAKLLEGRVGVFVDGTPFVLTVPYLLVEAFQSGEDYYSRPYYSSLVRFLRYMAAAMSALLPGVYIALESYHQEMIPTSLLVNIAAAREGIPFPSYMEVILMLFIYEILREAGVRLPRPIGPAISIVGGLVIGESAVRAGIITDQMVIVISLTAISAFVISAIADAISLLRVLFIVSAGFLGLVGIVLTVLLICIHLARLRSFGVPFLSPLAAGSFSDLKDVFIRAPWWAMLTRPRVLGRRKSRRMGRSLKPGPERRRKP